MTTKFEVVDKIKLVDAFDPKNILAIVLDPKLAKQIASLLNAAEEIKEEPKRKGRVPMSEEDKALRKELISLRAKCARYLEILRDHDLEPRPGRRRTDAEGNAKPLKLKREFKSKMCPGYEREAHLFTPTAGNQVLCPECRRKQMDHQRRACGNSHTKGPVLTTTMRGGSGPNAERIPTIDEVVAMMPGPEKSKWIMRMSPAEQKQYTLLKNKKDAERMRAMRHSGFTLDDPLMGVEKKD